MLRLFRAMPPPFPLLSDAQPVIIYDHPRKKNTVKSPPFSSDEAPYPPVVILDDTREKNIVWYPPFSSDAAPYPQPVIIYDHPRKKNTVKSPPFSSDAAPYPPPVIILEQPREKSTVKHRPFSSDAAPYPPPVIISDHPRKKNTVKSPPFSSDTAPYPPPVIISDHPRKKNTVKHPTSSSDAAPYPPPVIIYDHPRKKNTVKHPPSSSDTASYPPPLIIVEPPLPHPCEKNIVKPPLFSPPSNDASLLTFHSDSDDDLYDDDAPDHLSMVPKEQSADPKQGRSNNMTGTKKLKAFSKLNYGWGFWKKKEENNGGESSTVTTLSENELPEELPEAEPSISVGDLQMCVAFVHIIPSPSRIQIFHKLLPLQRSAIVLNGHLHLPRLGDMIHCQRARNPKLPARVPATILPMGICSVSMATLALWVVHIIM